MKILYEQDSFYTSISVKFDVASQIRRKDIQLLQLNSFVWIMLRLRLRMIMFTRKSALQRPENVRMLRRHPFCWDLTERGFNFVCLSISMLHCIISANGKLSAKSCRPRSERSIWIRILRHTSRTNIWYQVHLGHPTIISSILTVNGNRKHWWFPCATLMSDRSFAQQRSFSLPNSTNLWFCYRFCTDHC